MYPRIIEGQVWRDDGCQQTRYVKVIQILGPMVRVVHCAYNGVVDPEMRPTQVAKQLFGKSGGYHRQG